MNERDVRDLVGCLISTHDMLHDVAAAGPTPAIPPGLRRHLEAMIRDCGDPRVVLHMEEGQIVVDRDGLPIVESHAVVPIPPDGPPNRPSDWAPFPRAVLAIYGGLGVNAKKIPTGVYPQEFVATDPVAFDTVARQHGLVGPQLEAKRAVIDYGRDKYVAGGRLTDHDKTDGRWYVRAGRRLAKALAPAATVMDSMSNLPGLGILGMVKEGTEFVSGTIELASD